MNEWDRKRLLSNVTTQWDEEKILREQIEFVKNHRGNIELLNKRLTEITDILNRCEYPHNIKNFDFDSQTHFKFIKWLEKNEFDFQFDLFTTIDCVEDWIKGVKKGGRKSPITEENWNFFGSKIYDFIEHFKQTFDDYTNQFRLIRRFTKSLNRTSLTSV